jgi:leader peptidase (prepilin peptidase)/N-methyltransferase
MSGSHHAIVALLFLVFGSSVGSFLNVCTYRIPRGLSLLRPRSRCPRCLAAVCARDNIPVLGWLLLRGRCRQCGGAISARYPMVELVTGLCFAGVYLAWTGFGREDVCEGTGALGVLFRLLLVWSLIGVFEVLSLCAYDSLRLERNSQLFSLPRDSEKRAGLSSVERSGCGEGGSLRTDRVFVTVLQPASGAVREGCAGTQPASGDEGGNRAERLREGVSASESG